MKNLVGDLLNNIRKNRWLARENGVRELWKRNHLENTEDRLEYKIEEASHEYRDGAEVITFELWKRVDKTVITIDPNVTITTENREESHGQRSKSASHDGGSPI